MFECHNEFSLLLMHLLKRIRSVLCDVALTNILRCKNTFTYLSYERRIFKGKNKVKAYKKHTHVHLYSH